MPLTVGELGFHKLIEGHLVCLRPISPPEAMPGIRLVGELGQLEWPWFTVEVDGNLCVSLGDTAGTPIDAVFVQQFRSDKNEERVVRIFDRSVWEVELVTAPALVV